MLIGGDEEADKSTPKRWRAEAVTEKAEGAVGGRYYPNDWTALLFAR